MIHRFEVKDEVHLKAKKAFKITEGEFPFVLFI